MDRETRDHEAWDHEAWDRETRDHEARDRQTRQPDVRQQALDYLGDHQVMTLATVGPEGAWAAAVFYVNEGFGLYFLSAGHTRHAQNVEVNNQAAATIQEDYRDWQGIQGIQLEGTVQVLEEEGRQRAIDLYRAKFPFITGDSPEIQAALARVNWYLLAPSRLYFIDNRRGLGYREEVLLKNEQ